MMVQFRLFQLHDGAKNDQHSIKTILQILTFDLFPGLPGSVVTLGGGREPQRHQPPVMRVKNRHFTAHCVASVFYIFCPEHFKSRLD